MSTSTKAYAQAGVDIDLGNSLKGGLGQALASTHRPEVLGKVGGFGGLFLASFGAMQEPVLVSSIDGVGTKLRLALALDRHDTVGQDLVNHCVNDIAVLGARPLFFLDYIGTGKLEPPVFTAILSGLAAACRAAGCALIGGETAQMPGIYHGWDYDLVGCIVGVVDRARMVDGSRIEPGDVVIGLPSSGLHTNGYSLAREILFNRMGLTPESRPEELGGASLGDVLLAVHRPYLETMARLPEGMLKGAAHITGGGLIDNLPRVLPEGCAAVIDTKSWTVPPIFRFIQRGGQVPEEEMYQVFNMGVGMGLVVSAADADAALTILGTEAARIGHIEGGERRTRLA